MPPEKYHPPIDNPVEQPPEEKAEFPPLFSVNQRDNFRRIADNFINQAHQQGFDSLVFLDRSARPYSYLISERWKARFPDEQPPDIKFVKIGREMISKTATGKWRYPEDDNTRDQYAQQIREAFMQPNKKETYFAGKKVLVCDEFSSTGDTVKFAGDLFERAVGSEAKTIGMGILCGVDPFYKEKIKNFVHPSDAYIPTVEAPIMETDSILVTPLRKYPFKKSDSDMIPPPTQEEISFHIKKYQAAIKEIKEIARENLPQNE